MVDKDEIYRNPALRTGYSGDLTGLAGGGPPVRARGQRARDNRGHRAPPEGSGVVVGSGASAGGGGCPEDFDSDPQGGGGAAGFFPCEPANREVSMDDQRQDEQRQQAIARRAHEIWLAEGSPDGKDRDHWLRAEAEIDGPKEKAPAATSTQESAEGSDTNPPRNPGSPVG